jgi:serine protease Do
MQFHKVFSMTTFLRTGFKSLAIITLFTTSLSMNAYAYDKAKLFDAFLAIVMIKGYTSDGSMAYGSGVVIAPGQVITNCHIMRQTKEPWVARGEDTFTISSVKADRYHDMCLVTVENLPLKPATIGSINQLSKGAPIVSIGHSSANPSPLTGIGKVRAVYPFNDGLVISGTARFSMGASGSGMFDEQGRLIGINTFKSPGRNAYFYALPIEWLKKVEQLPEEKQFPITGKTFWEETEQDKPFFMQVVQPELNNEWDKLLEVAKRWNKAEPNNSEAWYEMGYAYEMTNQLEQAKQAYQTALKLNPQHTEAIYHLGLMAAKNGDEASLKNYQQSLATLDLDLAETLNQTKICQSDCKSNQ